MESCLGLLLLWNTSRITSNKKTVTLHLSISSSTEFCPVKALYYYTAHFSHTSGPLFQIMSGEPDTPIHQSAILQVSLIIGLNGSQSPNWCRNSCMQRLLGSPKVTFRSWQMALKCSSPIHLHIFIWYIIFNIYYNPTQEQRLTAQKVENTGSF